MFTVPFWRASAERALRTVAQTAVALIGVDLVSVVDIAWPYVAGVSATAGLLSLLTSVAASGVGDKGTPSLVAEK
jgi:hypothetical protein